MSGALALTALAVPAAQAAPGSGIARPDAATRFGTTPAKMSPFSATAEPVISKISVNGGANIVLGTTVKKTINVSVTASQDSGIADAYLDLWHGTNVENDVDGWLPPNEDAAKCTASSATTSTCKLTITIDPRSDLYMNALAGTWHVAVGALANDGSIFWNDYYTTTYVQRLSKLTVNASPEPVKKGATITVTGKLSRANWENYGYHGYATQSVQLQFRKATSSTYSTVKTIKTNSTGNLKTTVKAATDGYWRYSFAGTSTTPAVKTAGDFVDVK